MRRRARNVTRADAGMTLLEVVIAVSLLGLVIGPITGSFLIGLLESRATQERITDSFGAQQLATYLITDVQSAKAVTTGSTCVPTSLSGGTVRLGLTWDDPPSDAPTPAQAVSVAYIEVTGASGQHELHRASCAGSAAPTSRVIADNVATTSGFIARCDGLPCPATSAPREVEVELRLQNATAPDGSSYEALVFTLEAARRVGL